MRNRCHSPTNPKYHRYGGCCIRVCKRWDKFENFATDMGPHPGKGWSLERKQNNKGYSKSNCIWATAIVQKRNRSTTRLSLSTVQAIRRRYSRPTYHETNA